MKQRGHHINQAARPTAGVPGDLTNLHASPLLKSRPRNDHQRLGPARPHKNNTCTINTAYAPHLLVASFQTIFGGPCACDTSVRQKLIRLWFSNSSIAPRSQTATATLPVVTRVIFPEWFTTKPNCTGPWQRSSQAAGVSLAKEFEGISERPHNDHNITK